MGFFAALGTGFAQDQNTQITNQQTQENDLTKLSLQNILKNVDSYNKSKAEYQSRQEQAQSMAQITGGDPNSALSLINAGVPNGTALSTLARNAGKSLPGTSTQQTTNALGTPLNENDQDTATGSTTPASATTSSGSTSTPAASTTTPMPTAQSTSQAVAPNSVPSAAPTSQASTQDSTNSAQGLVKPTMWDTMFGNDPSANVASKAQAQAGAITGLSQDDMTQAQTGHYIPPQTANGSIRLNPSDLQDWSKFKASDYSTPQVAQQAAAAYARGDMQTVVGLQSTQQDLLNNDLKIAAAKKGVENSVDQTAQMKNQAAQILQLQQVPNPATGKPFTQQEALAHVLKVDNVTANSVNPQGLDPQSLYNSWNPQDQQLVGSILTGDFDPRKDVTGMKAGPERERLFAMAKSIDPEFNAAAPGIRQATLT